MPRLRTFDPTRLKEAVGAVLRVTTLERPSRSGRAPGPKSLARSLISIGAAYGNDAEATRMECARDTLKADVNVIRCLNPMYLRVVSLALALATDNADGLTTEERDILLRASDEKMWRHGAKAFEAKSAPAARHGLDRSVFDISFAWHRRARVGQKQSLVLASTRCAIREIDPSDAPVRVLLACLDGSNIEIRQSGGTWLRPVLAPGRFTPATLAQIASALASGEPWRDRPCPAGDIDTSRQSASGNFPALVGPRDVAAAGSPESAKERMRVQSHAEAINTAFSRMVVIGDHVFIPCEEPRIVVQAVEAIRHFDDLTSLTVNLKVPKHGWSVGNLTQSDPQTTLGDSAFIQPRPIANWTSFPLACDALVFGIVSQSASKASPSRAATEPWRAIASDPDGAPLRVGSGREIVNASAALLGAAFNALLPPDQSGDSRARRLALNGMVALVDASDDDHSGRVLSALDMLERAAQAVETSSGRSALPLVLSSLAEARRTVETWFDRPEREDDDRIAASFP